MILLLTEPVIHIIFTRFKEPDMTTLLEPFINKQNIIIYIYNKNSELPMGIPDNATNLTVINIPNLGWDSYAYIKHVVDNYDNLPDYIVNLHASATLLPHKLVLYNEIKNIVLNINNKSDIKYYGGQPTTAPLDFRIGGWDSTTVENRTNTNIFTTASIYPLGDWLKSKLTTIPDNVINNNQIICTWYGMFIVHKSRILKYPITFYKDILNEISVWQSEVNHYLERSWYAFYNYE